MPLWTTATPPASCGWALSLGRRAVGRPAGVADAGDAGAAARARAPPRDWRACPRRGAARSGRRPGSRCRRCHSRDTRDARSASSSRGAAGWRPMMPTMPHMARELLQAGLWLIRGSCAPGSGAAPSGMSVCRARRDAQAVRRHVAVDRAAGADDGAVADRDRRDQGRVRADEHAARRCRSGAWRSRRSCR